MKNIIKLLVLPLIYLSTFVYSQNIPAEHNVLLGWSYPTNEINEVTFNLYHTTDLVSPNWIILTNIFGNTNIIVRLPTGKHFFTITASNFWGESPFSNIASTPAIPRGDILNLKISKLPSLPGE